MNQISDFLAKLKADIKALPEHRCSRCGAAFFGVEQPLCFDCRRDDERRADRRRRALRELAAIDRRYATATLESYDCPPGDRVALDLVAAWDPGPRGLYLHGAPGAGKTHLAFGLARKLIDGGVSVFVCEWTRLLQRFKATFDGRGGEVAEDIHRAIERADVVVIDDFGSAKATDWAIEQAWSIVHGRYQSAKPLVLTCNFNLGELRQRIGGVDGARIASRLAEIATRVEVRAQDYRLRRAE